jgi:hypothetical protein
LLVALADASPAFTGHGLDGRYTAADSVNRWKRLLPKRPRPPHQAAALIEMRLITRTLAGYFADLTDRAADLTADMERARARCVNLLKQIGEEGKNLGLSTINKIETGLDQVVVDAGRLALDIEARQELASKLAASARVTKDRRLARIGTGLAAVLTTCSQYAKSAWSQVDIARRIAARLAALIGEGRPPARWELSEEIQKILDHYAQAILKERELVKHLKTATDRNPTQYLESIEIDASGADLSDAYIPDIDILDLVIWTDATTWPLAMEDEVRAHSVDIRKDVYQVRTGGRLPRKRVDV